MAVAVPLLQQLIAVSHKRSRACNLTNNSAMPIGAEKELLISSEAQKAQYCIIRAYALVAKALRHAPGLLLSQDQVPTEPQSPAYFL